MKSTSAAAFQAGSGVDPSNLKLVTVSITAAVVLLAFAWVSSRLIEAHQEGDISTASVVKTLIGLLVIALTLFGFLGFLQ